MVWTGDGRRSGSTLRVPRVAAVAVRFHAGTVITMLGHIAKHGSPAQAAAARDLIERLRVEPDSTPLQEAAAALVDAFLHDPYLTR